MPERGKTFIPIFCAGVILMLYTEFQYPTMSGTGQKVCVGMVGGGWVGLVCKPILVFRLAQAEQ